MSDDTVFDADAPWVVPIGTPGYTQQLWNLTEGRGIVIGGFGGILQANFLEKAAMLLMYISQIWQWTAGECLASNVRLGQPVSGHNVVTPGLGFIRHIDFHLGNVELFKKSSGTMSIVGLYGWVQFTSQGFAGVVHPINSAQSRIFPEADGFDGFNYFLWENNSGTADYYFYDPSTAGVDIGNGSPTNALSDLQMKLPSPSFDVTVGGSTDNPSVTIPVVQSAILKTVALGNQPERTIISPTFSTDYTNWMTLLALCTQAWNVTAGRIYEDSDAETDSFSAEAVRDFSSAFIRSVRITVQAPVPVGRAYEWSGGIGKYGLIAWRHDHLISKVIPINSASSKFVPEKLYTNGVWFLPAPGVTLNVQYGTVNDIARSMFTTTGEVNLVRGKIDGLTGLG